jgi:thioredoxin reductase (NADPH)
VNDAQRFDVIVAGGGIAGLGCALFLARAQLRVALFDDQQSSLHRVETLNNYLGFPQGISGTELLDRARAQVQRFGVVYYGADIAAVRRTDAGFEVEAAGARYRADRLIIASNKRTDLARQLGLVLGGFGGRFVRVDAEGQTDVPGCYAVGRITGLPSQAQISAGNGAAVAIGLIQRLRGAYYVDHDP